MAITSGPRQLRRGQSPTAKLLPPVFPDLAREQPEPQGSLTGDLGLSWEIGWEQMKGVPAWMQGAGASLLEKAGFEDAARGQRMASRRMAREMYERIGELESLYIGPHSWAEAQKDGSLGSYALWGINEAIKQVPNLAVMALTGVATGGAGALAFGGAKAGARFAIGRALARMPGAKIGIDKATGKAIRSTGRGASTVGVALGSALLNTGEIYSSALLETGETNPAVTGLAGLLAGSLDMWPGSKVIRNMGKSQEFGSAIANKFLRDKKWRSRLYRSLELGATESLVEDWQTVIEAFTVNYLNENNLAEDYVAKAYGLVPLTADQVAERMEARAAGALLGAVLGPFGRVGGRRLPRRGRKTVTIDDVRDIDEQIGIVSVEDAEAFAASFGRAATRPVTRPGQPIRDLTRVVKGERVPSISDIDRFEGLSELAEGQQDEWNAALNPNNTTTQAASAAVGGLPSGNLSKTEKNRIERQQQAALAQVNLDANLQATLEGAPLTDFPAPDQLPPIKGREDEAGAATVINAATAPSPAKDSPAYTLQKDIENATLLQLELIRRNKILQEQEPSKQAQKSLLLEAYLKLIESSRGRKKITSKNDLKDLLNGLGLAEENITRDDLGLVKPWNKISRKELEQAIESFIGEDIILSSELEVIKSEEEIKEKWQSILDGAKQQAALSRFESLLSAAENFREQIGDDSLFNLVDRDILEKHGLPNNASVQLKVNVLKAETRLRTQDEADRRAKAVAEKELEREKRRALSLKEQDVVAERVRERVARDEGKRIGFKGPVIRRKKDKPPRAFPTKQQAVEAAAKKAAATTTAQRDEEGKIIPETVVVTVTEEAAAAIPPTDYPPPAKDLETYQDSEEFYGLVYQAFTMSDSGQNMGRSLKIEEEEVKDAKGKPVLDEDGNPVRRIKVVVGPEGKRGSVKKMLERLFPDAAEREKAAQAYDQDYYEKNKLLNWKSLADIKREIARRRVAKEKGTYYDANGNVAIKRDKKGNAVKDKDGNSIPSWPETVSEAEVEAEAEKIKSFSPAGTYVIRHKPERNTTFAFEMTETTVFNSVTQKNETIKTRKLDPEGNPIPILKTHDRNVTQFPDRLFLYSSDDQVMLEQFVDDDRSVRLRSELDALQREFGKVENVPIKRLAELATKFHIRSSFIGAVATKGRASFISLEGLNTKTPPTVEMWFKPPKNATADDFLSLDGLAETYRELLRIKAISSERAWTEALKFTLEQLQIEANVRADLIIKDNPLATKKEIEALLKKNDAVFDKKRIQQVIDFANSHKDYLTNPESESLSIPKGDVVGVKQIWKSISQSVSLGYRTPSEVDETMEAGARAAETPYFETEASFLARASEPPIEPNQLAVGTKVGITAGGWKNLFQAKGSRVRVLSEKIQKLRIRRARLPGYVPGVKEDPKLDAIRTELAETMLSLENAIGEMLDRQYNLIGHKGDNYILRTVGGTRISVPKKYVVVKRFSQEGMNRVQANEIYSIRNKIRIVDEHYKEGAVVSETAQQKISNVILGVRNEIKERRAEIIEKKADGKLTDDQYQKQMEKLLSDRIMLIWERLASAFHEGRSLLPISKELEIKAEKEIAAAAKSLKITDWRKAFKEASGKERDKREEKEKQLIKARRKAYKKATDEQLEILRTAQQKEPRFQEITRIRRERREDFDILRIAALRTPEGGWRDVKTISGLIRDINENLKSRAPMVGDAGKNLIRRKISDSQIPSVYKMLQKLWDDLLFLRAQRVEGALTYEGRVYPVKWSEGKYWEFVESEDIVLEDAVGIMERAASEMSMLSSFRDGAVYAARKARVRGEKMPKSGIVMGYYLNAAPVQRWKNAYGVIIDKIRFHYVPTGGDMWHGPYEVWEVFEVNDPYSPNESPQYATFEEARKAFGNKKRYESLPVEPRTFPVNANILTRRGLKDAARERGRPTSVDTKEASLTTDEVIEKGVLLRVEYHSATSSKETDRIVVLSEATEEADESAGREDRPPTLTGSYIGETELESEKAALLKSEEGDVVLSDYAKGIIPEATQKEGARSQEDILKDIEDTQNLLDAALTERKLLDPDATYISTLLSPLPYGDRKKGRRILKKADRNRLDKINKRIGEYKNKLDSLKGEQMAGAPSGMFFSLSLPSETSDDGTTHVLYAEEGEGGSTVAEVINTLGEAFGRQIFQFLTVVQTANELPVDVRLNPMGFKRPVRGVSFGNQIWLVADALPANRVVPVALHEIGAHGFQAVMGERFYQKLMKQVALLVNTDADIRGIYESIKAENPSLGEPILLEETMAYIVEREAMVNNPFWRVVVDAILYGLARLKLWLNPKMIGAKDILVFAKAAARKHAWMAKDKGAVYTANFLGTFLYSGDFGATTSNESDVGNRGVASLREQAGPEMEMGFPGGWFLYDVPLAKTFIENFFIVRDITKFPAQEGKRILFKKYQVFAGHNFVKWVVDYFDILERLEESIERRGGVINEKNSPSLFHGAYKNIVNFLRRSFHNTMVQPLADYMRLHNIDGEDLHMFLYATHAPHRNRVKAKIANAKKLPNASGMWKDEEEARKMNAQWKKINPAFIEQTSAEAVLNGLKDKLGKEKFEKLGKAAQYIYAINQENLRRQLASGMITKEILLKSEMYTDPGAYATYVPLRGENIVVADEFFEVPIGPSKLEVKGPESKRAVGRYTPAENTWAWSIMQMDYEIDRIEKNKVVVSFAQLIKDNQEDLKELATVVSLEEFETSEVADTGQLLLGMHPKRQTNPNYNIHFKVNGQEYVILVTDKRIGQAFNRTNMTDSGAFLQLTSQINRYFSAIHTSINPEFVLTNFVRDFQTAMANLQGLKETVGEFKDTEALSRKVFKDIKAAGIGLKRFIRDEATDTEWSMLAKEFSAAGGRIDFFAFKDVRDFEKKLTDYIKDTTAAGAKRWKDEMLDFVGQYNAVVENTMRLATYKNAKEAFIENGMDEASAIRRAADISRNLTVNFSQKGEKGAALNSLYLFFNASVQGTVRLMQALFRKPTGKKGMTRVQKIAGGIMLYSFTQGILNAMLGGDDEDGVNRYRQIDLSSRGRQLHIYIPGFDTFFKIPLPYGYNVFHAMGDTLAALMMGHTNPGRATMHMMSTAAESFMPFSFGRSDNLAKAALQTITPTFAQPGLDLALNENYFGQPIYKDPQWGSSDPPSERYWSSTGPITKGISRSLNWLSGGSRAESGFISIPPDIFEYFWETLGGGAARFVERSTDLVLTIGPARLTHRETGDIKWTKVPFARRFFFDETASKKRFTYDKYSQYEKDIRTAVGMNKGILEIYGRGKDYDNFKESDDYKLFKLADYRKQIAGEITKLQKQRNKIQSNRILRNDVKEDRVNRLEDRMMDLREKLINKVDAVFER